MMDVSRRSDLVSFALCEAMLALGMGVYDVSGVWQLPEHWCVFSVVPEIDEVTLPASDRSPTDL